MMYFASFILGAVFGSVISAWVWRVRSGGSMLFGRSACVHCGHKLSFVDLIPLVGFLLRRGRCAYCAQKISPWYFWTELVLAILFLILFFLYGPTLVFVRAIVFAFFLAAIFVYDARYMEVPDRFSLTPIFLLFFIAPISFFDAVFGGLAGALFFAMQYAVSKGAWVGGGDIRIGALLGAALGPALGALAIFFAYMLGGAYGSYLLLKKKAHRRTAIAFGTFLSVGGILSFVFGEAVIEWYKQILI